MNKTDIEYLDFTWNPLAMRCSPISAGCQKCWHIRRAKMLAKNPLIPAIQQRAYAGESDPYLVKLRLEDPKKRRKPALIGVQFMGDLFHYRVKFEQFSRIMFTIEASPLHTFLILTKRPKRANQFLKTFYSTWTAGSRPLDNLWIGVSIEDPSVLWRVDELVRIPAAVRWISAEPLLEEIDFSKYIIIPDPLEDEYFYTPKQFINWIAAGPETGPGARECPAGAIENIYQQYKAAGIPFFDKREDFLTREFPE